MNTESIDGRKVETMNNSKPGDFCFSPDFEHIYLQLPGSENPDCLRIADPREQNTASPRTWLWDGNTEKPTLTPSIHDVGHWHGHLQNGRFISC